MAHTKSGGSTKLGRDSASKRLGVKRQEGEFVNAGEVLIRQRGAKYGTGSNVLHGKDDTLYSAIAGAVKFSRQIKKRFDGSLRKTTVISVIPKPSK